MKKISQKKRQQIERAKQARTDFQYDYPACMMCGKQSTDTHEIARGAYRNQAYGSRCAWLRLCRNCHSLVGDAGQWPIARQLALKKVCDPGSYDAQTVNQLRGRHMFAITEAEVDAYIDNLPATAIWKFPHNKLRRA